MMNLRAFVIAWMICMASAFGFAQTGGKSAKSPSKPSKDYNSPFAGPNQASDKPTESSSGFASGVKKAAPPAAVPTMTPYQAKAAPEVPEAEPPQTPPPSAALTISDKDIKQPRPIGPAPTPAPAVPSTLQVKVDGRPIAPSDYAILINPDDAVALEYELEADEGDTQMPAPDTMQLDKPRIYDMFDSLRTTIRMESGALLSRSRQRVQWQAPKSAPACRVGVSAERQARFEDTSLTALHSQPRASGQEAAWSAIFIVRAPFDSSGDGVFQGYPLGIYPNPDVDSVPANVRERAAAYQPPAFVVPVTPQTVPLYLTPHFRLGDFCMAEDLAKPHAIALAPELPDFLESLCQRLESEGLPGDDLVILRAFVSPYARQRLQRQGIDLVEFSRHQYGDAAAIIVDADQDGVMDDLNGDNVIDGADAERLADSVDFLQRALGLWGGVGVYAKFDDPKKPETPYVQLDLRGYRERWRRAD